MKFGLIELNNYLHDFFLSETELAITELVLKMSQTVSGHTLVAENQNIIEISQKPIVLELVVLLLNFGNQSMLELLVLLLGVMEINDGSSLASRHFFSLF